MITGYVDIISPGVIEGWAFDPEAPAAHLAIDVLCDGRRLASGSADQFRSDLATARLGEGDHAFRFGFDAPLDEETLAGLLVAARHPEGEAVELRRWLPERKPPPPSHHLARLARAVDSEPRPVFVLGAARSGTSALAQGLLRATAYRGNQEGHLLELLGGLDAAVAGHYEAKADDLMEPRRNTMIKMVSADYFEDGIAALFIGALRQLFPEGLWLDKTPEQPMIQLAPRLARIWPRARFVFVRRRALENLASRRRKFPTRAMAEGAAGWSASMAAWVRVRDQLAGRALEIDQRCLALRPELAAAELGALLDLAPTVVATLADTLREHRPEQTADDLSRPLDRSELPWSAAEWETFERTCGRWMDTFHYARDRRYFTDDGPESWCVRI